MFLYLLLSVSALLISMSILKVWPVPSGRHDEDLTPDELKELLGHEAFEDAFDTAPTPEEQDLFAQYDARDDLPEQTPEAEYFPNECPAQTFVILRRPSFVAQSDSFEFSNVAL